MSNLNKIFLNNLNKLMGDKSAYLLAKESGITSATISRIKAGKLNPTLKIVEALADGLGVDAAELLKEKHGKVPPDVVKLLEDQDTMVYDTIRTMMKTISKRRS